MYWGIYSSEHIQHLKLKGKRPILIRALEPLYKEGKILQANECFQSAVKSNSTDYHIYYDWAEMCEEVVLTIKGDEENETVWFENTIINFLMTIVYKLDKAKFVIPRMFTLIKQFSNQDMKN